MDTVTVSATAQDHGATVVLPDDEDGEQAGTQVALEVGDNRIVVTVKAAKSSASSDTDTAERRYSVIVTRSGKPISASVSDVPAEHAGANARFSFKLRLGRRVALSNKDMRDHAFGVTGGRIVKVRKLDRARETETIDGERRMLSKHWRIAVAPDGDGPVSLSLPANRPCSEQGAICAVDGGRVSDEIALSVPGPGATNGVPALTIAVEDAIAHEDEGVILFPITLSRALGDHWVAVDVETIGGTATPDRDYWSIDTTIVFCFQKTRIDLNITLRDDDVDDDGETFVLRLSNARMVDPWAPGFLEGPPVTIARAEATGTISNSDPMPRAWIARFGRTAARHVVDGVRGRLEAPHASGFSGTFAGIRFGESDGEGEAGAVHGGRDRLEALAGRIRGTSSIEGEDAVLSGRSPTAGDVLAGSAFTLTDGNGDDRGGSVALWGRGIRSGFRGREDDLALDGNVTTATLGTEWSGGAWHAGIALSHSVGGGTWSGGARRGEVESSLTGLYPYAGYRVTDRLSIWGTGGYGTGGLTLETSGETLRTGIDLTMAAAGTRGVLVPRTGSEGPALALETEGLFVRTTSDAAAGMNASKADVSQLRLGLDGSWGFALPGGGGLTPALALGVRHDGGDAETGFGTEFGSSLAFADASGAFGIELSARILLGHEDDDFRDWDVSGSMRYDPQPASERGLTLSLRQTVGGVASKSGFKSLLDRATIADLGAENAAVRNARLESEVAYGFPILGGRFIGAPHAGFGLSENGRDYTLGWRLGRAVPAGIDLALDIRGTRREHAGGDKPEHGFALRLTSRW